MWQDIIRLTAPDWNKRVFNEEDFHEFCETEGICITEAQIGVAGLYTIYGGIPFIVLDPTLRGGQKLWVEFHELAHHWLHIPDTELFDYCSGKREIQANMVAACALIPLPIVRSKTAYEIQQEYGYPSELLRFRFALFRERRF